MRTLTLVCLLVVIFGVGLALSADLVDPVSDKAALRLGDEGTVLRRVARSDGIMEKIKDKAEDAAEKVTEVGKKLKKKGKKMMDKVMGRRRRSAEEMQEAIMQLQMLGHFH
ncbi:uncharacterized protein [Periplaneta americana]|uniref:uncharacterized protein n=1 Tax=Periplaneta americana TaxID=6978 RepID=UPI0037E98CCE